MRDLGRRRLQALSPEERQALARKAGQLGGVA